MGLLLLSKINISVSFISLTNLVPRAGLEPATLGLEVLCSIQLSYRGALRSPGKKVSWIEQSAESLISRSAYEADTRATELPGRVTSIARNKKSHVS